MPGAEKYLKTKMLTVLTKSSRCLCVAIQSQSPVKGTSKRGKAFKGTSKGIISFNPCLTYYSTELTKWKQITILTYIKETFLCYMELRRGKRLKNLQENIKFSCAGWDLTQEITK